MKYKDFFAARVLVGLFAAAAVGTGFAQPRVPVPSTREITRAALLDRIYGGWAGMLIGGMEGLPHEFK